MASWARKDVEEREGEDGRVSGNLIILLSPREEKVWETLISSHFFATTLEHAAKTAEVKLLTM